MGHTIYGQRKNGFLKEVFFKVISDCPIEVNNNDLLVITRIFDASMSVLWSAL